MRILYCGSLFAGSTCRMRMNVLEEFGHEVIPLDTDPYYRMGGRYLNAIFRRLQWGPNFSGLHRILVSEANTYKPNIIWIDRGILIGLETLSLIKEKDPKALVVHYAGDPLTKYHRNRSRSFLHSIPLYDILFTTKEYELTDYERLGAQNLKLIGTAYSKNDHRPINLTEKDIEQFGNDISFIGHCEPWYVEQLSPLLELKSGLWYGAPGGIR